MPAEATTGYLELLVPGLFRKSWQLRWFVHSRLTGRLLLYENANQWINKCRPKENVPMEKMQVAVVPSSFKDRKHVFHVKYITGKEHYISARKVDDLVKWKAILLSKSDTEEKPEEEADSESPNANMSEDRLCEALPNRNSDSIGHEPKPPQSSQKSQNLCASSPCHMYQVLARETEDAQRLSLCDAGPLTLCVSDSVVSLSSMHSIDHDNAIYQWPFAALRSYGRGAESFSFQAGRRCGDYGGLFSFFTAEGEEIFSRIMEHTERIRRELESATSVESSCEGTQIPSRNSFGTASPVVNDCTRDGHLEDRNDKSGNVCGFGTETTTGECPVESSEITTGNESGTTKCTQEQPQTTKTKLDEHSRDDDLSNYDSADNVRAALAKYRQTSLDDGRPQSVNGCKENSTSSLEEEELVATSEPTDTTKEQRACIQEISVNVAAMRSLFEKRVPVPSENYENVKQEAKDSNYDHLRRQDLKYAFQSFKYNVAAASNYALMHKQANSC